MTSRVFSLIHLSYSRFPSHWALFGMFLNSFSNFIIVAPSPSVKAVATHLLLSTVVSYSMCLSKNREAGELSQRRISLVGEGRLVISSFFLWCSSKTIVWSFSNSIDFVYFLDVCFGRSSPTNDLWRWLSNPYLPIFDKTQHLSKEFIFMNCGFTGFNLVKQ